MKRQLGLSLIELMIAILISSLLLLGVLQLFSNTSASDRTNTALARVQESGRIALEIIGTDARRAGYQGCGSAAETTTVGSLTFPEAAIATATSSITFRYATGVDTGTAFAFKTACSGGALYLNTITYNSCPNNGVARLCKTVNGATATPILDNANITAISFGIPSGGTFKWKDNTSITTAELAEAHAVRVTLTVSDARNEISRSFTGTYELRNRL
ncbi:PilW family protein [Pseudomonas schmalbachii]|uniref:Prepilin-type N-terminal cleavage/methylation domain-containing protein n=1 Tax=Pseudomonas schmalbachii TaxID=2816993 RepID=A0ABS3TSW6_9PSED|nr:prepilin-type N-terminal cleavage/methylation domain-containing protein [Pseudomonas schmalbachii]MBO3276760.1 prepilin-type N-terminal cleavage/methylation domain-containing protein [Pseudomonas schmalbachii]